MEARLAMMERRMARVTMAGWPTTSSPGSLNWGGNVAVLSLTIKV